MTHPEHETIGQSRGFPCTYVATSPFHGGNADSNSAGDAKNAKARIDRQNRRYYERLAINKILDASTRSSTPAVEARRYLAAVITVRSVPNAETGCVEWQGAASGAGYGRLKHKTKLYSPHRVILEHHLGRALCSWEDACHHCDNPRCVRADHLFAGSRSDNMLDAHRKGRMATGRRWKKGEQGFVRVKR